MKIAFSTLACPEWSWQEIIENGPRYGYDGVEVRMIGRETDLLAVPEFRPGKIERRRRELADNGFCVCGLSSSVRFDYSDDDKLREQLEIGKQYLELARELGAEFVRVFGDVLPDPADVERREKTLANITDGLSRLGEQAAQIGPKIILETHGDFADTRLVQQTLQRVGSPSVGVLWDTHHPWRFCGEKLAESHGRLHPWIMHTHWKDSIAACALVEFGKGAADETPSPAEAQAHALMSGHRHADYALFGGGEFPAEECVSLLLTGGYDGWFSYEWEKAWHPRIEDPDIALPLFPAKIRRLVELAKASCGTRVKDL